MALAASGEKLRFVSEPSFLFYNRTAYLHGDYYFDDEYVALAADAFASGAIAVVLNNHALLVAGGTVPEAFLRAYMFEQAASIQLRLPATAPYLAKAEQEYHAGSHYGWPGGYTGALEWPGLLRKLDRLVTAGGMARLHRMHERPPSPPPPPSLPLSPTAPSPLTCTDSCSPSQVTVTPFTDTPFGASVDGVTAES